MRDPERKRATQKAWYERNKEEARRKARERMAAVPSEVKRARSKKWKQENALHWRALKRAQSQRQAIRAGRRVRKHDAHVREWKRLISVDLALHDQHVVEYGRTNAGVRWRFNETTRRLSDGYVRRCLCKNFSALRREAIPRELLELERARLILVRELKLRGHHEKL